MKIHDPLAGCNQPARREYMLAELRCAALRARLAANEIDAIGVLLANGWITVDDAVSELSACGALDYVETPPLVPAEVPA